MTVGQRSFPDLKDLPKDATLEEVIESYGDLVRLVNFALKSLSIQSNFNGYVADVVIPAATNFQIQHFLGVTPKWRVILRQEGNGVISDIPSGWNERYITVYNNGAGAVNASIWIVRE
jgi:hypothetical protein